MQFRPKEKTTQQDYAQATWIKQVADVLAKKFKVKVKKGQEWGADVKTGTLTYGASINYLTHIQALGILSHEIAHLRHTTTPTDVTDGPLAAYKETDHGGINALEDLRIEELIGKTYPGARESLNVLNGMMENDIRESIALINKHMQREFDDVNEQLTAMGTAQPYTDMDTYMKERIHLDELKKTNPEKAEMLRNLQTDGDYYYQIPSVVTQVLIEAMMQTRGNTPNNLWAPSLTSTAKKVAELIQKGRVIEMKDTQAVADYWRTHIAPLMYELMSEGENKRGTGRGPTELPIDKPGGSMEEAVNKRIRRIHKRDKGTDVDLDKSSLKRAMNYRVIKTSIQELMRRHARRLKQALLDNLYDRYEGNHRSGKINVKKLYKARTGNVKLFQRKHESDKKDFAFTVICDVSGSMGRERITQARKAVVLINELMDYCKAAISIYSFNYYVKQARVLDQPLNIPEFEQAFRRTGGGTYVVDAYEKSVPELRASTHLNKIHIVITDGQFDNDDVEKLRTMFTKHKDIRFYGIGIQTELDHVFLNGNHIQVDNIDDLVPALLRIVRKNITG